MNMCWKNVQNIWHKGNTIAKIHSKKGLKQKL